MEGNAKKGTPDDAEAEFRGKVRPEDEFATTEAKAKENEARAKEFFEGERFGKRAGFKRFEFHKFSLTDFGVF